MKTYTPHIDPVAEQKLLALLAFLQQNGLHFYNTEMPLIRETSEGSNKYVDVTISIKLS